MSAYNPSSNGLVEANVKDVKLTVPDILGQVSLDFDLRPGVGKKLLLSQKGFVIPVPDDLDCIPGGSIILWILTFRGLFK